MLALIDDWGNPSPGKSATKWFGFAAILLPYVKEAQLRTLLKDVCKIIGHETDVPLHFRNLPQNNKYHITQQLCKANPLISIVAVDIHKITSNRLIQRGWAYRYYGREMVRVATHLAAELGEGACVIFHRHEYLNGFEDYIQNKLRNNSWYLKRGQSSQILYDKLSSLSMLDDEDEPLLGFADCVAHGCYLAMNPDHRWQQVNPSCLDLLTNCIWEGPTYERNAKLFGAILEPGVWKDMIPALPTAIRRHWE